MTYEVIYVFQERIWLSISFEFHEFVEDNEGTYEIAGYRTRHAPMAKKHGPSPIYSNNRQMNFAHKILPWTRPRPRSERRLEARTIFKANFVKSKPDQSLRFQIQ